MSRKNLPRQEGEKEPPMKLYNRFPWYQIVRHFIFVIPAYVFRLLLCLVMLLGWGWDSCKEAWEVTK